MNKINVCFFSGDVTRSGGTERVSTIIANELVKNEKYNISFLSLFEEKENTFFPLSNKINRNVLYDRNVSGAKHLFGFIHRIHKFVRQKKIDILIDIDGVLDMYSIPGLIGTETKLISWEQFNYYQNPYVNYRKFTRKWAAKRADAIVVLTKEDKRYYETNLNIRNIIKHIYNPIIVSEQKTTYNVDSKEILSIGRLTEQKGFDILVEVANIVLNKHPDWTWSIIGEGEDREKLNEKIRKYELEDRLIIRRAVTNIEEYYQKASMYVLTSRYEGFGLVLTEAKSFHLPCVSFRCPAGPAEIIKESVNGYLVDCFEVEVMAQKICELIENKELRISFSEYAMADSEKFSIQKVVKEWEDLFGDIMNNGR